MGHGIRSLGWASVEAGGCVATSLGEKRPESWPGAGGYIAAVFKVGSTAGEAGAAGCKNAGWKQD